MKIPYKTITIGICAFNEEKNLSKLIAILSKQKTINYCLKKIIILNDGSTDNTAKTLYKFVSNKLIVIKNFKDRKGKAYRLNWLYNNVDTDLLFTIDADVISDDLWLIEKLASQFNQKEIGLVNGNALPIKAETLIGKVIYVYEIFWRKVTSQINDGNNINNSLGCLMGLSRNLYTKLQLPEDLIAEDHYIYLKTLKLGFKTKFAKNVIVYFRVAQTLNDFLKQYSRYSTSQDYIIKHFGKFADKHYRIKRRYKFNAYLSSFIASPFKMVFALLLQLMRRVLILSNSKQESYLWKTINSSK